VRPAAAEHPRYSISVAAELAGMHPQTLRMYDAKGLVSPRRTPGGTRRYSDSDIERLRKVGQLTTELGLTLTGAIHVLTLEATVTELHRKVRSLEAQLVREAERLHQEVTAVHRRYRRDLIPYTPPKHPERWTSRNSR
jgi:MerR family transcriptional regulator/heat shock protein HspR